MQAVFKEKTHERIVGYTTYLLNVMLLLFPLFVSPAHAAKDWSKRETRAELVKTLSERVSISTPEDWYKIRNRDFIEAGGVGFLARNKNRVLEALKSLSDEGLIVAPKGGWTRKKSRSHTNWSDPTARRDLVERLVKVASIKKPEDWYQVTAKHFLDAKGSGFSDKFNNNIGNAVLELARGGHVKPPKGGWKKSKFQTKTNWSLKANRQRLIRKLETTHSIKEPEDWYELSTEDFRRAGGKQFLLRHDGSVEKGIRALSAEGLIQAPADGWKEGHFGPHKDWKNIEVRRTLVARLKRQLAIESPEDWYRVSAPDIRSAKGGGYLGYLGTSAPRVAVKSLSEDSLIQPPSGGWKDELFYKPAYVSRAQKRHKTVVANSNDKPSEAATTGDYLTSRTNWDNIDERRSLVERLVKTHNLTKTEDWYRLGRAEFEGVTGSGYLARFSSVGEAVEALSNDGLIAAPSAGWYQRSFGKPTKWDLVKNRKELVARLREKYQMKTPEDWYRLTVNKVKLTGGSGYMRRFSYEILPAIRALSDEGLIESPKGGWVKSRFQKGNGTDWDSKSNRRRLVQKLRKAARITQPADWYNITGRHFTDAGGGGFLANRFSGRPSTAILSLSSEELIKPPAGGWDTDRFNTRIDWDVFENRQRLAHDLIRIARIKSPEDWYNLTVEQLQTAGANGFLSFRHGNQKIKLLESLAADGLIVAPVGGWDRERFRTAERWDKAKLRAFVERANRELKLNTPEDWYRVTPQDVCNVGGKTLLYTKFTANLPDLVKTLSSDGFIPEPQGGWNDALFVVPRDWNSLEARRDLTTRLATGLYIQRPEDWYRVTSNDFNRYGGSGLLARFGSSPREAIMALSDDGFIEPPKKGWDALEFTRGLKSQKLVARYLEVALGMVPNFNDKHSHGVRNPATNARLEADVAFPSLKIAVEYQGPSHWKMEDQIERDIIKRREMSMKGWLLVEVWENKWDRSMESLLCIVETTLASHPDPKLGEKAMLIISRYRDNNTRQNCGFSFIGLSM